MRKVARASLVGTTVAILLSACAVGPNYVRPESPAAPVFAAAEPAVFSPQEGTVEFWKAFGDPTLDRLIGDALAANHDLRIALARLEETRAIHRLSQFDLFPTVTASGSYTREELPAAQSFGIGRSLEQSYYDAGFDASWELDFFGRVRRNVEAARAEAQGAAASLEDAQVSVTAEVARVYFELRGQQDELAVARRNVENQTSTLDLTRKQLDAGRGTEFDTSRAQAQLSTTRASIAPLEAAIARSMHRLAVLTGREPTALTALLAPERELPALPQIVAVGDPAALLRRRPDIRVAERALAASTARVGVAVADLFPRVTFNGSFGYAAGAPSELGAAGTRAYTIGPAITWAAFDLGRVHARIQGARADSEAALAGYEKTVLGALEETENALVTHARSRDRLAEMSEAARESRTAAEIARRRFEGGMSSFLEVLVAEHTQLDAEDQLAQSRTDTATTLIAVYKALGGAWQRAPELRSTGLTAPAAVSGREGG
jgi:multidrug efflux system outer membrane protein